MASNNKIRSFRLETEKDNDSLIWAGTRVPKVDEDYVARVKIDYDRIIYGERVYVSFWLVEPSIELINGALAIHDFYPGEGPGSVVTDWHRVKSGKCNLALSSPGRRSKAYVLLSRSSTHRVPRIYSCRPRYLQQV